MNMKIALISDIHGNLHALKTVLEHIESSGVDTILCAGDLIGYGAYPNEVLSLLREKSIPCVQGNYDFAAAHGHRTVSQKPSSPRNELLKREALWWATQQLTPASRQHLKMLPFADQHRFGNVKINMLHASLNNLEDFLTPETPQDLLELCTRFDGDVFVLGHTHLPFHLQLDGKHFINPGSVGRPLDLDPRASFAVLDLKTLKSNFYRVDYPVQEACAAIVERGMSQDIARLVRHGLRRIDQWGEHVAQ